MKRRRLLIPRGLWGPIAGAAMSFVVTVSGLAGGLFVWGPAGAAGMVLSGLAVGLAVTWLSVTRAPVPAALRADGFALAEPEWMASDPKMAARLHEAAKSALILLALDRSPSGFWGTTYLYRRHASRTPVPAVRGSLGGSPLALLAVGSCLDPGDRAFCDWAWGNMAAALSNNLAGDGNYVLEYRVGTVHDKVPLYEPLRHAAGGLLAQMLLGQVGERDTRTLRLLLDTTPEDVGWTKVVIFRTLLQASYHEYGFPYLVRRRCRQKSAMLLEDLVETGSRSVAGNHIWADAYDYGTSTKNQWMTLWAALSGVTDGALPRGLRAALALLVRRFLRAQCSIVTPGHFLPEALESDGTATGEYIFGTAVAAAAWSVLDHAEDRLEGTDSASQKALVALLVERLEEALFLPSTHPPDEPMRLEGYFAWAGILLAAGTAGVRLSSHEFRTAISLAENCRSWNASSGSNQVDVEAAFMSLLGEVGFLEPSVIPAVARAAARIRGYQETVDCDEQWNRPCAN